METTIEQWLTGLSPDPDPNLCAQTLSASNLQLLNWLNIRDRPALFWGWHPEEKNSMAFEHESIRRALVLLGFNTIWVRGDTVLESKEATAPQVGRLFITGADQFGPVISRLNDQDIIVVHNLSDYTNWKGKVINYLQFFASHPARHLGLPTPYPSDLLPFEITSDSLSHKNNYAALFVGSRYSPAFYSQHEYLGELFQCAGIKYSFWETWNAAKIHQGYCSARWAPVVQQDNILTFTPSRFVKAMSRGCIPLSINPIIEIMLGEGSEGCVFGSDWDDVLAKVKQLNSSKNELEKKSLAALAYARDHTALHFLEYIWPDSIALHPPSQSFIKTRASLKEADRISCDIDALNKLLKKYPKNRVLLALVVRCYINKNSLQEAAEALAQYNAAFPKDETMFRNFLYEIENRRRAEFPRWENLWKV